SAQRVVRLERVHRDHAAGDLVDTRPDLAREREVRILGVGAAVGYGRRSTAARGTHERESAQPDGRQCSHAASPCRESNRTRTRPARGTDSNTPSGPARHRPRGAYQPWSERRATRGLRVRAQASVRSAMSATASRLPPPPPPAGAAITVRVTLFWAE